MQVNVSVLFCRQTNRGDTDVTGCNASVTVGSGLSGFVAFC